MTRVIFELEREEAAQIIGMVTLIGMKYVEEDKNSKDSFQISRLLVKISHQYNNQTKDLGDLH